MLKNSYLLIIAVSLYLISLIFSAYHSYTYSPEYVIDKLESRLRNSEKDFENFIADTSALAEIAHPSTPPEAALEYINDELGLYVYTRNDIGNLLLVYWNNHEVIPQLHDLDRPDGKYFVKYASGEFELIKKTKQVKGNEISAIGLVPIRSNYFFENKYLKTNFTGLSHATGKFEIDKGGKGYLVKNGDGKQLFALIEKKRVPSISSGYTALFIRLVAVCLMLILLNLSSVEIVKKLGFKIGVTFLIVSLLLLRIVSYFLPVPFDLSGFELFDPSIYASNMLHPSLGDLLVNMLLLFWVLSFSRGPLLKTINDLSPLKSNKAWYLVISLSVLLLISSFTFSGVIRSLIVDSQVSFDVGNFSKLTIYTLVSFFVLCIIALSFFYFSQIILILIQKAQNVPAFVKYISIAVAGLIILSVNIPSGVAGSNLAVLGWLLLYLLLLEKRKTDIFSSFTKSAFFFGWLMIFAGSISALIIYQNKKLELDNRKELADKLAMQADPSAESMLSIGITNFTNNFLSSNFSRISDETGNKQIKDSLIKENLAGFLNKYDTRIYTYDRQTNPLYNDDDASYAVLTNIISNQSKKTGIPDVYYFENSADHFSFLYQKEIRDTGNQLLGYFFVVAKPKKYKKEALYPELFKQVKDITNDVEISYPYAVYSNGDLLNNSGDYPFVSKISKRDYPQRDFIEKRNGDYKELWYNAGNNKLVIVVISDSVLYEAIALFAYLFGTFLFIIAVFRAGKFIAVTGFNFQRIKEGLRLNVHKQIQTTIIFISLFSFIVIGVATISFYINRFNKTNRERLIKAIQVMANDIQGQIVSHRMFDDAVKMYDMEAKSNLESSINEISELHSVDVNFYDINGNLKVSTQPYIYNKNILSEMMEPMAYYRLHFNNDVQYLQEEKIGQFKYLSIYVPVKDENGHPYAYLNIPYLNSQKELDQEISNFLVTLINLNAFIFVIAGALALLLTNRISASFTLIGSKMKEVSLGKANEAIEWSSRDEIGELVNEYNKMVKKLEESAQALAKSEREGAWREMARQVAHEIKNPLTPMKLSIQFLQKAIEENRPGIQELGKKVAITLIEQIEQLSKIASDFSQFANIGIAKVVTFDVNEVLHSLVNLYSSNDNVQIEWNSLNQAALVTADRNQINRLFTNLLQNAVEASAGQTQVKVQVSQQLTNNKLLFYIRDFGAGIPDEMLDKIFTPNFTTKSSGTGLGLAICKGIVEKANGKIWFETEQGNGTVFYVSLPYVGLPS